MLIDDIILDFEKSSDPGERALALMLRYGQIDGADHKAWVIDQAVRIMFGQSYDDMIALYKGDDEYEWDIGVPP